MKLTIVIPAHNEEESLPATLDRLLKNVKTPHKILVVDDHSIDNTSNIVLDFAKRYSNIELVENDMRPGFTSAIKKGFSKVKEDAVVAVMADGCDDPKTTDEMFSELEKGYDVVCASRYMPGGKKIGGRFLQTIFSRWLGKSLYFLASLPTHDASNAFKMYKKKALDSIEIEEAGFASSLEIIVKLYLKGYKITEVPTIWRDRIAGKSSFNISKVIKNYMRWYLWALFARRKKP